MIYLIFFQSQCIEFQWEDIKGYDLEEEGMTFSFEYERPGKKPRVVQILTPYVSSHYLAVDFMM